MNQQNETAKKMGQLIAKCWEDETLKARLIANPRVVLQEFGIEVPAPVPIPSADSTFSSGVVSTAP